MDLTRIYLDDIGRTDLLDADDEVRLAQAIEAGNDADRRLRSGTVHTSRERNRLRAQVRCGRESREQFVAANLRLVVAIARHHLGGGVDLADLIQEGNIGLIHAVERFDWRRGFRFSTYASWWIRQAVLRAVDMASPVHIPTSVLADSRVASRTRAQLEIATGRAPTTEEVAKASGLPPSQVEAAMVRPLHVASLSAPVGDDESELGDFLIDLGAPSPEAEATDHAMCESVRKWVEMFPSRPAAVLRLRYGLDGHGPLTLEEVAARLGISRERVRQIEQRALIQLRRDVAPALAGARGVA